jgi:dihydroneopterin aldolase
MTDRIVLAEMAFEGRHGVHEWEQETPQPFEVDVELELDLRQAGESDELDRTVDYSAVHETVRGFVEGRSYRLIEALAEAIAGGILAGTMADRVVVRVRKPAVQLGGALAYAGVEIARERG